MPKVSVIVAVYNVAQYLKRSMDCLMNQTLKDIEFICIDDCSIDGSLSILREYAEKDSRFKVISSKKNCGAAVARNKGLEVATGEYLGFIDPDDAIDLNYYEELYKKAIEENSDIIKCERKTINVDGSQKINKLNECIRKRDKHAFSYEWTTAIYKHSMIKENNIVFPEECRKAQDVVFLNRCVLAANRISLVDNIYYYYYRRKNSLNAIKLPLNNLKSALKALNIILYEINSSSLYEENPKSYIMAYKDNILSRLITFTQAKSFYAKYLCAKSMIDNIHRCKNIDLLYKYFNYKWMLPYIQKKKILKFTIILLEYKRSDNYHIKKDTIFEHFFSIKNKESQDNKWYKVINILGIKFKLKNKKLTTIKNSPKVSIIIPCYNVEHYLKECFDSIFNQSLKDIEIVCIDDGSTDNTLNILKDFAKNDKRIKIFSGKNKGAGPSRNKGINIASGEYIYFLDADDFYPTNDILKEMYEKAKEHNVNIVGGEFSKYVDGKIMKNYKGDYIKYLFPKQELIKFSDYQFDYGYTRFLYNRVFLKKNKLKFPPYTRFQDPPFLTKALHKAGSFYALSKTTYLYRKSHKQVMWTPEKANGVLKGLRDNLKLARKYNYKELLRLTSKRLYVEYAQIIKSNLDFRNLILLIENILLSDKTQYSNSLYNFIVSIEDAPRGSHIVYEILGLKIKIKKKNKKEL